MQSATLSWMCDLSRQASSVVAILLRSPKYFASFISDSGCSPTGEILMTSSCDVAQVYDSLPDGDYALSITVERPGRQCRRRAADAELELAAGVHIRSDHGRERQRQLGGLPSLLHK